MSADDLSDASRRVPSPAGSASDRGRGPAGNDDASASEVSDIPPAGRHRNHPGAPGDGDGRGSAADTPERRGAKLSVRLREGDRAEIDRRAEALGVRPSAWARAVLLDALDARRGEVEAIEAAAATPGPDPAVAAAVEQLRRVGVLLNQVVRSHHQGEGDGPDMAALSLVLGRIDSLRDALGDRTSI